MLNSNFLVHLICHHAITKKNLTQEMDLLVGLFIFVKLEKLELNVIILDNTSFFISFSSQLIINHILEFKAYMLQKSRYLLKDLISEQFSLSPLSVIQGTCHSEWFLFTQVSLSHYQ